MALSPLNISNLQQLSLKGLSFAADHRSHSRWLTSGHFSFNNAIVLSQKVSLYPLRMQRFTWRLIRTSLSVPLVYFTQQWSPGKVNKMSGNRRFNPFTLYLTVTATAVFIWGVAQWVWWTKVPHRDHGEALVEGLGDFVPKRWSSSRHCLQILTAETI